MTRTVYGVLAEKDGLWSQTVGLTRNRNGRLELRHRGGAISGEEVRHTQPARIPVDRDHDGYWVGEVVHLERRHGHLWAVAHVRDDVDASVPVKVGVEVRSVACPLFFSPEMVHTPDWRDIAFRSVTLTASPARLDARLRPLRWCEGDCAEAASRTPDSAERDLLKRARAAQLSRHGGPIVVADLDRRARQETWVGRRIDERNLGEFLAFQEEERFKDRPPGPIEHRPGGRIISVR